MVEDVETPKVVVEVLTLTECLFFRERTLFAFQREAYDFVSFIKELFKPGIVPAGFVGYHIYYGNRACRINSGMFILKPTFLVFGYTFVQSIFGVLHNLLVLPDFFNFIFRQFRAPSEP